MALAYQDFYDKISSPHTNWASSSALSKAEDEGAIVFCPFGPIYI